MEQDDRRVSIVALRLLPMFETLDEDRLATIVRAASLRRVARQAVVLHAGDHTDNIYLILSGGLKVLIEGDDGR
ncbi:MAG TPA: cyclic nucleotide-binding domain-containing protein [Rhodocyclaceae bacterium]|nr:cyclic nucleotide-binding domain-containing protein [Rhodocyclaceae bacterium]